MPCTTSERWVYDGSIIGDQRDTRDSQETNTGILDNCTLFGCLCYYVGTEPAPIVLCCMKSHCLLIFSFCVENLEECEIFKRHPPSYGDRFIPRRYALCDLQNVKKLYNNSIVYEDVLDSICEKGYWRQHNYKNVLDNILGIKPSRILQLSDGKAYSASTRCSFTIGKMISSNKNEFDWPCKPRAKPLAFADSTHDLPGFKLYSDLNIIAWSSKGHIAGSFERDLVLWSPETNKKSVFQIPNCTTVAVNHVGDIMAIGYIVFGMPVLKLIDTTSNKGEPFKFGQIRYPFSNQNQEVRSIEWDPSDQVLLCGTKDGNLYLFDSHLQKIKELKNHKTSITSIKFSPNAKYFATCDIEGNVIISLWSSCEIHAYLVSKRKSRTIIDWHPWSGTDLVICKSLPASILVFDVLLKRIVAFYQRTDRLIRIDAVAFNKLSGELVVSYTIRGIQTCEIVVMASLNRIVDVLETHEDSVKFLLWSFNGLQLATAGDDNTLTFWNFFGNRDKGKLKKLSKTKELGNNHPMLPISQFADILNTYVKHNNNVKRL